MIEELKWYYWYCWKYLTSYTSCGPICLYFRSNNIYRSPSLVASTSIPLLNKVILGSHYPHEWQIGFGPRHIRVLQSNLLHPWCSFCPAKNKVGNGDGWRRWTRESGSHISCNKMPWPYNGSNSSNGHEKGTLSFLYLTVWFGVQKRFPVRFIFFWKPYGPVSISASQPTVILVARAPIRGPVYIWQCQH